MGLVNFTSTPNQEVLRKMAKDKSNQPPKEIPPGSDEATKGLNLGPLFSLDRDLAASSPKKALGHFPNCNTTPSLKKKKKEKKRK